MPGLPTDEDGVTVAEYQNTTRGIRIIPVASNRIKVLDEAGTTMLDIFDLQAGRGLEISTYAMDKAYDPPAHNICVRGNEVKLDG